MLSKLIFSVRSKILNIKEWQPWQFEDDNFVACYIHIDTMTPFYGLSIICKWNIQWLEWHFWKWIWDTIESWNGNRKKEILKKKYYQKIKRLVEPTRLTPQLQDTVERCYSFLSIFVTNWNKDKIRLGESHKLRNIGKTSRRSIFTQSHAIKPLKKFNSLG